MKYKYNHNHGQVWQKIKKIVCKPVLSQKPSLAERQEILSNFIYFVKIWVVRWKKRSRKDLGVEWFLWLNIMQPMFARSKVESLDAFSNLSRRRLRYCWHLSSRGRGKVGGACEQLFCVQKLSKISQTVLPGALCLNFLVLLWILSCYSDESCGEQVHQLFRFQNIPDLSFLMLSWS